MESDREQILDGYYLQHPNATRISEDKLDWYDWNQCKNFFRDEFFIGSVEKKLTDSLEQWYDEKAERQVAFADKLTLCSPTLSVHRQMTDLAGTSRHALKVIESTFDEAQRDWSSWFLKKFNADQNLTVADYDEFMRFPDKVQASALPGGYAGLGLLLLQCLLAGIWAWWIGRR